MKFGVAFANVGPFVQPEEAAFLARSCEEVGIESLWTVEHVAVPTGYQAQYPYSADGRMPGSENSPIPDPLLWLAYVAAVTTKIRLATGILILPQRHPIYVAKEVATLDVLSKGRALLGIGIGWMEDEFRALGIPFEERVARTEEACAALRTLWKPGAHAFKSEHYAWEALESNPKPVQPGGVPIIVGGHVLGAARRAARVGDGFFPMKTGGGRLARAALGALRRVRARRPRSRADRDHDIGSGPRPRRDPPPRGSGRVAARDRPARLRPQRAARRPREVRQRRDREAVGARRDG